MPLSDGSQRVPFGGAGGFGGFGGFGGAGAGMFGGGGGGGFGGAGGANGFQSLPGARHRGAGGVGAGGYANASGGNDASGGGGGNGNGNGNPAGSEMTEKERYNAEGRPYPGQSEEEFFCTQSDVYKLKCELGGLRKERMGNLKPGDERYSGALRSYQAEALERANDVFWTGKKLPDAYLLGRSWYKELGEKGKDKFFDERTTYHLDAFGNNMIRHTDRLNMLFSFGAWTEIALIIEVAYSTATAWQKDLVLNAVLAGMHSGGKSYLAKAMGSLLSPGIFRFINYQTAKTLNVGGAHDLYVNYFDELTEAMLGVGKDVVGTEADSIRKAAMTDPVVRTMSIVCEDGQRKMLEFVSTHHNVNVGAYNNRLPDKDSATGARWWILPIDQIDAADEDSIVNRMNQTVDDEVVKLREELAHKCRLINFYMMMVNYYIHVGVVVEPEMDAFHKYFVRFEHRMESHGYKLSDAKKYRQVKLVARQLTIRHATVMACFSDLTYDSRFDTASGKYRDFFDNATFYARLIQEFLCCTRAISIFTFSLCRSLWGNPVGCRIINAAARISLSHSLALFDDECFDDKGKKKRRALEKARRKAAEAANKSLNARGKRKAAGRASSASEPAMRERADELAQLSARGAVGSDGQAELNSMMGDLALGNERRQQSQLVRSAASRELSQHERPLSISEADQLDRQSEAAAAHDGASLSVSMADSNTAFAEDEFVSDAELGAGAAPVSFNRGGGGGGSNSGYEGAAAGGAGNNGAEEREARWKSHCADVLSRLRDKAHFEVTSGEMTEMRINPNYIEITSDSLRVDAVVRRLLNACGTMKPSPENVRAAMEDMCRNEVRVPMLKVDFKRGRICLERTDEGAVVKKSMAMMRIVSNSRRYDAAQLGGHGRRVFVLTNALLNQHSLDSAVKDSIGALGFHYTIPGRFLTSMPKLVPRYERQANGERQFVTTHRVFDVVAVDNQPGESFVLRQVDPIHDYLRESIAQSSRQAASAVRNFRPEIVSCAPALLIQAEPEVTAFKRHTDRIGTPLEFKNLACPPLLEVALVRIKNRERGSELGNNRRYAYPRIAAEAFRKHNTAAALDTHDDRELQKESIVSSNDFGGRRYALDPVLVQIAGAVSHEVAAALVTDKDGNVRKYTNADELRQLARRYAGPPSAEATASAVASSARAPAVRIGDPRSMEQFLQQEKRRRHNGRQEGDAAAAAASGGSSASVEEEEFTLDDVQAALDGRRREPGSAAQRQAVIESLRNSVREPSNNPHAALGSLLSNNADVLDDMPAADEPNEAAAAAPVLAASGILQRAARGIETHQVSISAHLAREEERLEEEQEFVDRDELGMQATGVDFINTRQAMVEAASARMVLNMGAGASSSTSVAGGGRMFDRIRHQPMPGSGEPGQY